ncbi:hypothetical protein BH24GEM2_BH24GEM2_08540 [soil metagenome]
MTESENTFAPTEQLNRLAALGKVSGELLHDMANLVAVVRGRATLALGDARTGRIPIGELDRLAEASEELGSMLRDVMEVLAGRAISPEVVFDPRTVTERVIERFLDTTPPVRIRLSSSVPAHLRVAGRASFFSRAVLNLLTNAARHAESEIEVSLSTIERQEEHLLVLTVEDDGPGMDPQQVEAAFQPLVSGEAGRPGLGLSSVAWSMSHLAGEVSCHRSAALGGACFELCVPLVRARERSGVRMPASLKGVRLLFLEDDDAVREAMMRLLERMGSEVVSLPLLWSDEDDLISGLLRARPDVVLLDLRLGAHSGLEIWKVLQSHLPALARRVVFVSGLAPGHPEWETASHTEQPVLAKPLDLREIARTVEQVMGSSPG